MTEEYKTAAEFRGRIDDLILDIEKRIGQHTYTDEQMGDFQVAYHNLQSARQRLSLVLDALREAA